MPQNHKTLEDLRKAATLAEKTVLATSASAASIDVEDITKRVLDAVTDMLTEVMAFSREQRDDRQPPLQTWSRQRQGPRNYGNNQTQNSQMPQTNRNGNYKCRWCKGKTFHSQKETRACPFVQVTSGWTHGQQT